MVLSLPYLPEFLRTTMGASSHSCEDNECHCWSYQISNLTPVCIDSTVRGMDDGRIIALLCMGSGGGGSYVHHKHIRTMCQAFPSIYP